MATERQKEANRANSKKSSGPKTEAGKAKSSLNHVSHGFTSSILMVKDLDDRNEFDALTADLIREFQPATPHEQILVEKMIFSQWNSLRAIRLQSVALTVSVHRGFLPPDLGLLIRYQTTADRAYHKAHAELLMAQKERKKSEIGFDSKSHSQPQEPVAAGAGVMTPPVPVTTESPDFSRQQAPEVVPDTLESLKKTA